MTRSSHAPDEFMCVLRSGTRPSSARRDYGSDGPRPAAADRGCDQLYRLHQPWNGYFTSFPDYVIYPRHIAHDGASVAVLGATTGSHLGLPDDEEMKLGVIWLAQVADGRLSLWRVAEDAPEFRLQVGIPATA